MFINDLFENKNVKEGWDEVKSRVGDVAKKTADTLVSAGAAAGDAVSGALDVIPRPFDEKTYQDRVSKPYPKTDQRTQDSKKKLDEEDGPEIGSTVNVTTVKGKTYTGELVRIDDNSVALRVYATGGIPHAQDDTESRSQIIVMKKDHVVSIEDALEEDIPPPENARKTQIASTLGTYKKAGAMLDKAGIQGKSLDFGAGLGKGTAELGKDAESYEPYPREDFKPNYIDATQIPSNSYSRIVNLNVLNVVPNVEGHRIRDEIVRQIGRVLAPGGMALITTRGRDVLTIKGTPGEEPMSMISSIGTYQKGFTSKELKEYVQSVLGDDFEVSSAKLGPAGVMIKKHKESVDETAARDKLHQRHQEIRKQAGRPHPDYYKELRATFDLPDDERWAKVAELKKKYKVAESLRDGEHHTWTVHFDDGTSGKINVQSDETTTDQIKTHYAKKGKTVVKVDKSYGIGGQQTDAPRRAADDAGERADRERQAHIKHDRRMTEQGVAEGKPENPGRRGFLKALAVAAVLSSTPVAKLMSDASSKMSIVKHRGKLGKYQGSDIDCTGYNIGKKQFHITVDGEPYTVQTGTGSGFMGQDFKNPDFKSDPYLQKIAPWLTTKDEYILQIADYDIELYDQNNQKIFPAKDQQQTKEMYSNGFIDAIIGYLDVYQTSAIQQMAEVPSEPHYPEELPAIDKGSKGVSAIASKAAGNNPLNLASLAKSGYDAITKKPDAQQSAPKAAPAALPAPSDDNVLRPELNKQKEKSPVNRRGVAEGDDQFSSMMSKIASPESMDASEALALIDDLMHQAGASYQEAVQQASVSYGIKPAKLNALYKQRESRDAFDGMFGGSNPASKLGIKEEQLDELSPKTLMSYSGKAQSDAKDRLTQVKAGAPNKKELINKAEKRVGGIRQAHSKVKDPEYGKKVVDEDWSNKYKRSIDCSNPKGFSQKAHCAGRKKNEDINEDIERYVEALSRAGYEITEAATMCPECGGPAYEDKMLAEKQDACYHKVKSRYKVWPSAYASGALVRCRKAGAKNWGNKSKK
jgi:hypothetical protein